MWKLQLHPILALGITVLVGGWVAALAARLALLDRRLAEMELWAARERGGGALLDALAADGDGGGGEPEGEQEGERDGDGDSDSDSGSGGGCGCGGRCTAAFEVRALMRRVCADQRALLAAALPWATFSIGFYAAYVFSSSCLSQLAPSRARALICSLFSLRSLFFFRPAHRSQQLSLEETTSSTTLISSTTLPPMTLAPLASPSWPFPDTRLRPSPLPSSTGAPFKSVVSPCSPGSFFSTREYSTSCL